MISIRCAIFLVIGVALGTFGITWWMVTEGLTTRQLAIVDDYGRKLASNDGLANTNAFPQLRKRIALSGGDGTGYSGALVSVAGALILIAIGFYLNQNRTQRAPPLKM